MVKQYNLSSVNKDKTNKNRTESTNLGFPPPCSSPAACGGHDCCFKTRPLEPRAVACETKVDARMCFPLPRPLPLSSQSNEDKQTQINSGFLFFFNVMFPSVCLWANANHLRVHYWFSSPGWPLSSSFLYHWWKVGESTEELHWKRWKIMYTSTGVYCASQCTFRSSVTLWPTFGQNPHCKPSLGRRRRPAALWLQCSPAHFRLNKPSGDQSTWTQ